MHGICGATRNYSNPNGRVLCLGMCGEICWAGVSKHFRGIPPRSVDSAACCTALSTVSSLVERCEHERDSSARHKERGQGTQQVQAASISMSAHDALVVAHDKNDDDQGWRE